MVHSLYDGLTSVNKEMTLLHRVYIQYTSRETVKCNPVVLKVNIRYQSNMT